MDVEVRRQVEKLHASDAMAVVAVTGGGAQALSWLLAVPGASRTILELVVPYAASALADFVGYKPQTTVALETARDMAHAAYNRAGRLGPQDAALVGVGCTAALTTDRPKRGEHRCLVAVWTQQTLATYELTLVKGLRDRTAEDDIASRLVLRALAQASGVEVDIPINLDPREAVKMARADHYDHLGQLLAGYVRSVTIHPDGSMARDKPFRGGVLPGSFDPIHDGHVRLAEVARGMLKAPVAFELSVLNVDKPPLEQAEILRRADQFAGKVPVVVTRASTFREKASLFPGCTFVIGWDTAVRLLDPRYHQESGTEMLTALREIRDLGCRFLVAGRVNEGVFHNLHDLPVPPQIRDLFTDIPETAFRCDVSSTELRVAGRQA